VTAWTLAVVGVARMRFSIEDGDCECVGLLGAGAVGPFASVGISRVQKMREFITSNPILANFGFVNDNDKSMVLFTASIVMIYEKMPLNMGTVSHHAPIVVIGLSRYIGPSVDFDHIFLLKPVFNVGVFTIENDIHNRAGIFPKDKSHLRFASFHVVIPILYKVFINPRAFHRSQNIGKFGIGLYIWSVHIFQDVDAIKSTVPLISEDDFSV